MKTEPRERIHLTLNGTDGHYFNGRLTKEQAVQMVQLFAECEAMIAETLKAPFGDGAGI